MLNFKRGNTCPISIEISEDKRQIILEFDNCLDEEKPVKCFRYETNTEALTILLAERFRNVLENWKKKIAGHYDWYLDVEEISKIKAHLIKCWDGRNHRWK